MPTDPAPIQLQVEPRDAGTRLDVFLAREFLSRSRVQLRRAITAGHVLVDGNRAKPAYRLNVGQKLSIELPELPREAPVPEPIDLNILFEDESLVAINKPPGMVVHPSRGHWGGTLTNALAYHFTHLSGVGGPTRPGIVHRLDRDTSGVIVVAKSDQVHAALASQWQARTIQKEYFAIVAGTVDRDRDTIDCPIGVHPRHREKMAVRVEHATSRAAHSFYEVARRFKGFSTVHVWPRTGRTHQIRVHLAHIGYPVLCDRLYGGRSRITLGELNGSADGTVLLGRQALHAHRLALRHPVSNTPMEIVAPIPGDLRKTVDALQQWR